MLGQQRRLPRAQPPGEASRWQQGSRKPASATAPALLFAAEQSEQGLSHRKGKEISDGEQECLLWEPGG